MRKNIQVNKQAQLAISFANSKKTKNEDDTQRKKLKTDIIILSNKLYNEKKINKSTYNKMDSLVWGRTRGNTLEDAYNALIKVENSKESKVFNKGNLKELNLNERLNRQKEQGKEDKFMMMITKNKNKKNLEKYHLNAIIKRSILYTNTKTGKSKMYKEEDHSRVLKGHDMLTDSRVVEATSKEEAQMLFFDQIKMEQEFEEYSAAARVNVDDVQFIDDPVVGSQIKSSNPKYMPLRQAGCLEYNFTEQETKYLLNENTCVIDNLVGLYGKELKLNRDKIINLNKEFHGIVDVDDNEPEYIESDLGDMIINPKYKLNKNKELENAEAKLKQYEEEYIKTQHEYYIDEIQELKEYIDYMKSYVSTSDKPVYNIDNAFTPAFIEFFCKKFGISHYAYDIHKVCFMKYVHKNQNHRALCYYAMNNHMYLVKNKDLVKSMVEKAKAPEHKINTSLLELDEVKNYYKNADDTYKTINLNETVETIKSNIIKYSNCVMMYSRTTHNINDVFEEFIKIFNTFPVIKKCNKTNIMEFHFKPSKDNLIIFTCDPNDINVITYEQVKELCIKNKVEWKNQTYTGFITQLKNNFYDELNGRIKFSKEQRLELATESKFICNMCKCCIKEVKYEIDHKIPLSGGGTNEKHNLQVLCKACHSIKTSNEHETGQYIKINDTESTFNKQVQDVFDSPLSQTHAFVEKVYYKELQQDQKIYSIDINKCRKNILYYGEYDYCVFTVFDKVEEFKGRIIKAGLYYVESDNYMPLRGNGWYYHNMICYCLENNIIKLDNIKYVIKSSLTIKKNYYNKFIDHCYKNIEGYSKLAINSMIGNFKPNLNKREVWISKTFSSDSCEAFNTYLKYKGCFIDVMNINNTRYYHTFEKVYNTTLENQVPIYNQILQQEQIELHKLEKLIKAHKGVVLDYNTDAINCVFPDNVFPFDLVEDIQLNGHYWDKSKSVYKYKIECDKERLKVSKMQQTLRTDIYKDMRYYTWKLTSDVEDDNFEPLVEKVMKSNQSYFITGPGGSGKTTLLKLLQEELTKQDKKYTTLCPTNLAALIAGGITIHKFSSKLKKQSQVEHLDLDYIFVDEVSMLAEVFYKFLMMIKRIKPDIKFIISGDFSQLLPVNDRISIHTDYSNAPCLFELADYNKLELTKCRRADDTLYNLIKFDNIPNVKPSDFTETDEYKNNINLCFTNKKRIEINHIKMKEVYNKKGRRRGLKLDALPYDDRSQAVILYTETPIISKVNNDDLGLINNQRYKIKKIDTCRITIQDDLNNEIKINVNEFQKFFLVAYGCTIHSAQGMSIGEPYTIHEWHRLDQRLKYVALSRSRDIKHIHIMK